MGTLYLLFPQVVFSILPLFLLTCFPFYSSSYSISIVNGSSPSVSISRLFFDFCLLVLRVADARVQINNITMTGIGTSYNNVRLTNTSVTLSNSNVEALGLIASAGSNMEITNTEILNANIYTDNSNLTMTGGSMNLGIAQFDFGRLELRSVRIARAYGPETLIGQFAARSAEIVWVDTTFTTYGTGLAPPAGLFVSNSTLHFNRVNISKVACGCALYNSIATISNSTFTDNTIFDGAGVHAENSNSILIELVLLASSFLCLFAIFLLIMLVTFENSTFASNVGNVTGGALYLNGGYYYISNCTVS